MVVALVVTLLVFTMIMALTLIVGTAAVMMQYFLGVAVVVGAVLTYTTMFRSARLLLTAGAAVGAIVGTAALTFGIFLARARGLETGAFMILLGGLCLFGSVVNMRAVAKSRAASSSGEKES